MRVYNRILKGQLGRMGVDFESFDLTGGIQELDRFEPNVHLARLSQAYRALDENLQATHPREFASSSSPRCQGLRRCRGGSRSSSTSSAI